MKMLKMLGLLVCFLSSFAALWSANGFAHLYTSLQRGEVHDMTMLNSFIITMFLGVILVATIIEMEKEKQK
jgi:hypothetical protein